MRRQVGDHAGVVAILDDATDRDGAEDRLLARALRSLGRLDAAEALARDAALRRADPALWLELARCRLARADLDGAEAACADAAVLAAGPSAEVLNLRMVIAIHRGQVGAPAQVGALFHELKGLRALDRADSAVLGSAARLLEQQGQTEESLQLQAEAAQRADAEGDTERAAGLRLNLGLGLERVGRISDARSRYQEALHLADGAGLHALCQRIHASWCALELAAGRLPDAENHLRAFERLVPIVSGSGSEERLSVLRAELAAAQGRPAEALAHLAQLSLARLPPRNARHVGLLLADLQLGVGELDAAADSLEAMGPLEDPIEVARGLALRGRLALAHGRALLRDAVAALPTEPSPSQRKAAGEILLASGGEDVAPAEITRRRAQLDLASRWLRGPAAGRAAALRDLLQVAPGASLDDIVALTESMADPQAFPAAIASLVREALGAHRVLIMLRMPGLGKVTWTELSGAEATGICAEVLKRIQRPEQVWLAANAFEDLELRESSQTVRTFELKSLLAVAVSQGEEAIGAIYVDDKHRADRFGEAETQLLQRLGRAVGGLLPVVGAVERLPVAFAEPVDILGVRTSDRHHVDTLRATLGAMGDRHRRGHQVNLLLTGPTGAGKSVLVERLAQEVFGIDEVERVVLHNGDPQMLVATLAGARKGEFTGAADSVGAIQRAIKHRRVLFLDELQNLEDAGQQVLLPLLELPIRRFGGLTRSTLPIGGELHVILGTNAPVALGAWEAVFREDLWYRMSTLHLDLPPLQERGVEAVYRYLVDFLAEWGAPAPEEVFTTATLRQLTAWAWPGNLRQLRAFADRSAQLWLMRQSPLLEGDVARLLPEAMNPPTLSRVQRAAEAPVPNLAPEIWSALQRQHFVQKQAARELGISPSHLNKLLRRAGLQDRVKDLRVRRRKRNGD